jgi:hypothetical protein
MVPAAVVRAERVDDDDVQIGPEERESLFPPSQTMTSASAAARSTIRA